ncbi:MAG: amino acid permease [Armatimonadetes bacterium]|nr:amino acid permease [Armatimonadota bacterium]
MKRRLGLLDLSCLGLNCVIGSGIFLTPGVIASELGPAGPAFFFLGGALCFLIALCFAEMASMVASTGGAYVYAVRAFGPRVGFMVGWVMWISGLIGGASVAVGFGEVVSELGYGENAIVPTAIITVALLALLNFLGTRVGALSNDLLAILKMAPLAVFALWGAIRVDPGAVMGMPTGDVLSGFLFILYAFSGFEWIPIPAGEVEEPQKNVPRALAIVLGTATLLYVMVQACVESLGLAGSKAPVADAAAAVPALLMAVTVGSVASLASVNAGIAFTCPRSLWALSRDGWTPEFLARLHPRFGSPSAAIGVSAGLTLLLVQTGSFAILVHVSVLVSLLQYLATILSMVWLRWKEPDAERRFRVPGGLIVPSVAFLVCGLLLVTSQAKFILGIGCALLVGAVFAWLRREPGGAAG